MIAQTQPYFDAVLSAVDGTVLAHGRGHILPARRGVNFESDFVPLYPLGTPLCMTRFYRGQAIHRFCGTVFLSDRRMLRLVSVTDLLLPGSELVYCDGMDFSATLSPQAPLHRPTLRHRLSRRSALQAFSVNICELTPSQLVFQHSIDTPFDLGQRFSLSAAPPLPIETGELCIVDALLFGERASYQCSLHLPDSDARDTLHDFLVAYNLSRNHCFD